MLPIIPKPAITPRQKAAALAVAGVVDLIQMGGFAFFGWGALSPLEDGLDLIAAAILVAICGFKWQFVLAFLLELLPVVDIFPTWTALVLTLPTTTHATNAPPYIHVSQITPPPQPEPAGPSGVVDVDAVTVPPVQPPMR